MTVTVGQVTSLSSEAPVGTIVIGEPRIADVALEGRTVLVFGKSVGETDLVVFSEEREILFHNRVSVLASGNEDSVIILAPGQTGVTEARWKCPPGGRCMKEAAR